MNDGVRAVLERRRNRREVLLVAETQMIQALSNAPLRGSAAPVELMRGERPRERGRARVRSVELSDQASAPGRIVQQSSVSSARSAPFN